MIKSAEDLIDQFIEDLDFDVLIIWADTLEVEHDEELWLDDMWPDKENELRVAVGEALLSALQPIESKVKE